MLHNSMTRSEFLLWHFIEDVMSINSESSQEYPLVYEDCNMTFLSSLLKLHICIFENEFEARITINLNETSVSSDRFLREIAEAGKENFETVASRKFPWDSFSFDDFRNWVLENGLWTFSN